VQYTDRCSSVLNQFTSGLRNTCCPGRHISVVTVNSDELIQHWQQESVPRYVLSLQTDKHTGTQQNSSSISVLSSPAKTAAEVSIYRLRLQRYWRSVQPMSNTAHVTVSRGTCQSAHLSAGAPVSRGTVIRGTWATHCACTMTLIYCTIILCTLFCRSYSYMDYLFSCYCRPYVFTFYVTFIPVTVCECHIELRMLLSNFFVNR